MIKLISDCVCIKLAQNNLINGFDCGDNDLNDFFNHDAILFQKQSLGQTHYFRHKETGKIICAFSLQADSVKTFLLSNNKKRKVKNLIPHNKSLQSYPAYLIGRLGVSVDFGGQGIGSQVIDFVKEYSLNPHCNYSVLKC